MEPLLYTGTMPSYGLDEFYELTTNNLLYILDISYFVNFGVAIKRTVMSL
jgi:hypothetical protein